MEEPVRRRFVIGLLLISIAVLTLQAQTRNKYYPSVPPRPTICLTPIGNYRTGVFADGASEIVAFDKLTSRLFSVNAHARTVDVLNLSDPSQPTLLFSIDLIPYGKNANSIALYNGVLAVAVENNDTQAPGRLLLFRTSGTCKLLQNLAVGAPPDMVTFTPNGWYILVANEGEPNDAYTNDPEGSVSIVDIRRGPSSATVATAGFSRFNNRRNELLTNGVRIFGPGASVAQDLEPEYIAVSKDSRTAWVTLQENNAIAKITIPTASVDTILPLGTKDGRNPVNAFDASDKDGQVHLHTWPVHSMYLPDAIAAFSAFGKEFLITANEGKSRDYSRFSEEVRVKKLTLDPEVFPYAANLQRDENLGRLKVTTTLGDIDGDGDYDELYAYGGRSFAIWSEVGELVYESGSLLETITAEHFPNDFNANNAENGTFDGRSDNKGPEPEGIAIGRIGKRTYAFIGMERIGGIVAVDVTNPQAPVIIDYINTRDFSGDPTKDEAGDLAPEGLIFVPASSSPTHTPLVIAGYEVSGSITIFAVMQDNDECQRNDSVHLQGLHQTPTKHSR